MYAVSIIGRITSFMETRTHLFGFAAGPGLLCYEHDVMNMSTCDMTVRLHDAGETLPEGNGYHFSQGRGAGRKLGVFKELKGLSSERMESRCSFLRREQKKMGLYDSTRIWNRYKTEFPHCIGSHTQNAF